MIGVSFKSSFIKSLLTVKLFLWLYGWDSG